MPASDQAELSVDLAALAANYKTMQENAGQAETSAVVKADGYGLGMAHIAPALAKAGCKTFWVAQLNEAITLRALLPDAVIYVLNGVPSGTAAQFEAHDLRPCLITLAQVQEWQSHCRAGKPLPACLFIDSGFNRLGFGEIEIAELIATPDIFEGWELSLIASHLACADEPKNPMNGTQLERFRSALAVLPDAPASLANSGGTMLGPDYHFDMIRTGTMLYGCSATAREEDALQPIAGLRAPLLQIRQLSAGDTIGYGATFTASGEMTIGVASLGYGDGLSRYFGNQSPSPIRFTIGDQPVSLLGRISMDSLAVDLTNLAALPSVGDMVEIFGHDNPIDRLAHQGNTISYELLTSLGNRYNRIYK
ncbi:alanine racemase [Alphaproteobacteria bacterium]|nr:alanine racemase [Alphaproteobacteria bacterium]